MTAGWGCSEHHSAGRQTKGSQELLPSAKAWVLVVKWEGNATKARENEYKKDRITTYLWQFFFWQDIYRVTEVSLPNCCGVQHAQLSKSENSNMK